MPTPSPDVTFNAFLFATVCEEPNEAPLSVLSVLARSDLDPWTEAAELARMPTDLAAHRLSLLLAGVAARPPSRPDAGSIAVRLVSLLPRSAPLSMPSHGQSASLLTFPPSRAFLIMCLAFLASMTLSAVLGNLELGGHAAKPSTSITPTAAAPR